jgi:hypothetical protein
MAIGVFIGPMFRLASIVLFVRHCLGGRLLSDDLPAIHLNLNSQPRQE